VRSTILAWDVCIQDQSALIRAALTRHAFFCRKPPGNIGIHEAATFQVNEHVQACAVLFEDSKLLAKLGTTDMVALEAKYHTKCLVDLYNRA